VEKKIYTRIELAEVSRGHSTGKKNREGLNIQYENLKSRYESI